MSDPEKLKENLTNDKIISRELTKLWYEIEILMEIQVFIFFTKCDIFFYMRVEELNKYYDKLQLEYGEPTLCSIYNGGCQKNPDVCFVFMNPTGRNVASTKEWKGIRAPWIGTKNIWKLYYNIGIIEKDLFDDILAKKPSDWTEEFAKYVYDTLSKNKVYVTNLGIMFVI